MKEKILIIGGSGSLGKQLVQDLKGDYNLIATTGTYFKNKNSGLVPLDITNRNEVDYFFRRENPDIVIVTAAKTNVEACEINPNETFKVNVEGLENVIANSRNKKIIFYSTDTVFDGTKRLYNEEDIPNPINSYGQSKLEGEKLIREIPNHLICRSSRYYSLERKCPKYLNTIINNLEAGNPVKVPINTPGNFTFIPDIAHATLELIKKNKIGTYHVAGADVYSLSEAAFKVAEVFGFNSLLISLVEENYFNTQVKRPCSPLSIDKLNKEGIKMSTLEQGLITIKNN